MIFISIGSNLGNRLDNIYRAINLIENCCLKKKLNIQ